MNFDRSEFFSEAVHQNPASIVITNVSGAIQYVNPKFESLTGYSLEEVLGRNPRFLNSGYTPPEGYGSMWKTLKSGKTWRGVFRNKKKNGEQYWESASISPMKNDKGETTHYLAIKEDITLQKEYEFRLQDALKTVELQREEMIANLDQARATQLRMLPQNLPQLGKTHVRAKYAPVDQIGGDYYDVVQLDEDKFAFLIADVTGHGVSAALISCLLSSEFRNALLQNSSPENVLREVNNSLLDLIADDQFASAIVGVLNSATGELRYAVGGHPDMLVYKSKNNMVERLTTDGFLLGMVTSEIANFTCKSAFLQTGDRVILYSDAFSEVIDDDGIQLGIEGLSELIIRNRYKDLADFMDSVFSDCKAFAGGKPFEDDATLLAIEFSLPSKSENLHHPAA